MANNNKKKRYYKVDEVVFVKGQKVFGVIKGLNVNPADGVYKATIELTGSDNNSSLVELDLWEIDKDKRKTFKRNEQVRKQPAGLNKGFYQVRDFHRAFNHPIADTPTRMNAERALSRAKWMQEEVEEFLNAVTVVDQADAMIDLMYFALGTMVEIGVKPNRLFDIVQNANMAKLFPDGKPRYREEDGKIVKPDGWLPPEPKIKAEIERQIELVNKR